MEKKIAEKYELIIGRHCLVKKPAYLAGAVEEAKSYQANALMIYLGAPQNSFRQPLSLLKIPQFQQVLKDNSIQLRNVIVHASYLINLANTVKREVLEFSREFLKKEIQRMTAIGLTTLVLHPGSCSTSSQLKGLEQIIQGLDEVLTSNPQVKIALETMSGKGQELGTNFQQLKFILEKSRFPARIGVCWDTCHLYSAGYDLKDHLEEVIEEFDQLIGLEKLWIIHLNDSVFGLGAKKDRHANIGQGKIGLPALKKIVHHPKFHGVIKLLETPRKSEYYRQEIQILKEDL